MPLWHSLFLLTKGQKTCHSKNRAKKPTSGTPFRDKLLITPKNRQKSPNFNVLISIYHLPIKVYSKFYQSLHKVDC